MGPPARRVACAGHVADPSGHGGYIALTSAAGSPPTSTSEGGGKGGLPQQILPPGPRVSPTRSETCPRMPGGLDAPGLFLEPQVEIGGIFPPAAHVLASAQVAPPGPPACHVFVRRRSAACVPGGRIPVPPPVSTGDRRPNAPSAAADDDRAGHGGSGMFRPSAVRSAGSQRGASASTKQRRRFAENVRSLFQLRSLRMQVGPQHSQSNGFSDR